MGNRIITERLLQFIWQFQYISKGNLETVSGEAITIIFPGAYNTNQGPDFLQARLKIGNQIWAGNIELHVHTSDWNIHNHGSDKNFENIILHVVWEHDKDVNTIPVLELKDKVSNLLLDRYASLLKVQGFIPCEAMIKEVLPLRWIAWKDRLVAERMESRASHIFELLNKNENHWEDVLWQMVARSYGLPVNSDAFEAMACSLPISLLAKYKHSQIQLEALLMGQAGLLHDNRITNPYYVQLVHEYNFLQHKHQLSPIHFPVHMLRMRPANFPTVRLAQLAAIIYHSTHLFSKILAAHTLEGLTTLFKVSVSTFWKSHISFDEVQVKGYIATGQSKVDIIVINTVIPILYAYALYHKDEGLKERALHFLQKTKPEVNKIITQYRQLEVAALTAYDTQALLQLYKDYCTPRKCLSCSIGAAILKKS